MGNRLSSNKKILQILHKVVHTCPDWRFGQIIFNVGIVTTKPGTMDIRDPFFEESIDTLNRVKKLVSPGVEYHCPRLPKLRSNINKRVGRQKLDL